MPVLISPELAALARRSDFEVMLPPAAERPARGARLMAAVKAAALFLAITFIVAVVLFAPVAIGCLGRIEALEVAGITVNKNTVPGEHRSPFVTSGLRIGTPALTTRGMTESDMCLIADWISEVLASVGDAAVQRRVRGQVGELCRRFPLYPEMGPA